MEIYMVKIAKVLIGREGKAKRPDISPTQVLLKECIVVENSKYYYVEGFDRCSLLSK